VHGRWRSRARDGGVDPAVRRPMKPCHCSGLRSWGSSASKPITPRYKLLETAVYDEYARWCERGRPRGIPLLDCELSETAFADARKKGPGSTGASRGQHHPGSDFYVANRGDNTIVRMGQDGTVVAVRRVVVDDPGPWHNASLNGIATSTDGKTIYVTFTGRGRSPAGVLALPAF
jgi:hypothetical protein